MTLRLLGAAVAALIASCGGGSDADAGARLLCQSCASAPGAAAPVVASGFTLSGVGASVFDMPLRSARYVVAASHDGNAENFAVRIAGRLVINEVIGTGTQVASFDGRYLFDGGVVEVLAGPGVQWSFTEIR